MRDRIQLNYGIDLNMSDYNVHITRTWNTMQEWVSVSVLLVRCSTLGCSPPVRGLVPSSPWPQTKFLFNVIEHLELKNTHNHFTALWTLFGTTWVSWYQKVHFTIFWIFWFKMKIIQADTPTIRMDCHPIQTNCCPISAPFGIKN